MRHKHEVIYLSPNELDPYENNSNTHSNWQIKKIAESIKSFGFTNPVLINKKKVVMAGHGRVMAAESLKLEKIPTIMLDMTDEEFRAYVIADNQLARLSEWDHKILASELIALDNLDVSLDVVGFDDKELAKIRDLVPDAEWPDRLREEDDDNNYTKKVQSPIYEITGEKPDFVDMYDTDKTESLIRDIEKIDAPDSIKDFLRHAAGRHTVFNYHNIAEYYAHASKDVQELMEDSALVIIDFDKAIEKGFVKLSEEIADAYKRD